jgi:hypothetical protein
VKLLIVIVLMAVMVIMIVNVTGYGDFSDDVGGTE